MANIAISLEGIEQAIENLKYRPGSVKQKALIAIRAFYDSEDAIKTLNFIDTDALVKKIWDVEDDLSKIKSKRRNFFSLKSSINTDLKKLSKKELNPENIIIADANIFDMSEEAKSDLLNSFTNAVKTSDIDLEQATGILKAVTDFLETLQIDKADNDSIDIIKEIKKILNKLTHEVLEDEELEEIELDEGYDLEVVDGLDKEGLAALDEFREQRKLAEHFDDTLGEREKKFNVYITVPKGNYTVGTKKSLKTSLELQEFEMPEVHIGRYPVTNSLFEIFVDQTGYVTTAEKKGFGIVYHARYKKNGKTASWSKSAGSENVKDACWHKPSGPGSTLHGKRNHPVVQVSVDDALAYASWIGRRIPTEAEWESAARTDLGYKYPWGNQFKPTALNIEQSGICDTCPVDEYDNDANEFKIVDLLGNIMEWTSDMEKTPFKTKKETLYCIAKGGAWNALPTVTISSRALFKNQFSSNTIGFRCISEICL